MPKPGFMKIAQNGSIAEPETHTDTQHREVFLGGGDAWR